MARNSVGAIVRVGSGLGRKVTRSGRAVSPEWLIDQGWPEPGEAGAWGSLSLRRALALRGAY